MRRKPYTELGLSRVPCLRCGKPSTQQWQICSLGNKWAGVCTKCDVALNKLVLKFMRIKNQKQIIKAYAVLKGK
ncbi:MAG TPA: hypothetical protein ENH82_18570 [bacterium]|nr:hypothetical protein [bacterium]